MRKIQDKVINPQLMVEVFKSHRERGCAPRPKSGRIPAGAIPRSSVCLRRCRATSRRWKPITPSTPTLITFESSSSGGIDLEAIGKTIAEKKIAIGVIDHHTLQVESPDEVAEKIRAALKFIPPERPGDLDRLRHGP